MSAAPASIDAIDATELIELLDFIAQICAHRSGALCTILCASHGAGYDADEIAADCRRLRDAIVMATS
ncbi:MAG: hypothetical protein JRN36_04700 [Nitrososphaerota archaeon]|nr:hypothetical protein [Nitrososphaerota archaeon]